MCIAGRNGFVVAFEAIIDINTQGVYKKRLITQKKSKDF